MTLDVPADLAEFVPFNELSELYQREVLSRAQFIKAAAGEVLFKHGDSPEHIDFLLSGEVELISPSGYRETVVAPQWRLPLAPAASKKAPMLQAWPMHMVLISGLTNCMVS